MRDLPWSSIYQFLNWIGIPTIIGWFMYDRKRIRAEGRKGDAEADVAEGKAPLEIRTSSIVSLESEIVAITKSFESDRRIKEATLEYLKGELTDARAEIESKDALIDSLKKKVRTMMEEIDTMQHRLMTMEHELERAHRMGHD